MAVGDHFRLALIGGLASQTIVSVWHYRQATANTSADTDVKSLAKAFKEYFIDSAIMLDCQGQGVSYGSIESRSFPLPPTPPVGFDLDLATTGTQEIACLPPTVAAVVRRRTALLGRAYRGRIFVAGMPVTWASSGQISGVDPLAAFAALGATMISAIVSATAGSPSFIPEICTILRDPITLLYSYRHNDVISYVIDKTLRSQRRREVGRGV